MYSISSTFTSFFWFFFSEDHGLFVSIQNSWGRPVSEIGFHALCSIKIMSLLNLIEVIWVQESIKFAFSLVQQTSVCLYIWIGSVPVNDFEESLHMLNNVSISAIKIASYKVKVENLALTQVKNGFEWRPFKRECINY